MAGLRGNSSAVRNGDHDTTVTSVCPRLQGKMVTLLLEMGTIFAEEHFHKHALVGLMLKHQSFLGRFDASVDVTDSRNSSRCSFSRIWQVHAASRRPRPVPRLTAALSASPPPC